MRNRYLRPGGYHKGDENKFPLEDGDERIVWGVEKGRCLEVSRLCVDYVPFHLQIKRRKLDWRNK